MTIVTRETLRRDRERRERDRAQIVRQYRKAADLLDEDPKMRAVVQHLRSEAMRWER